MGLPQAQISNMNLPVLEYDSSPMNKPDVQQQPSRIQQQQSSMTSVSHYIMHRMEQQKGRKKAIEPMLNNINS